MKTKLCMAFYVALCIFILESLTGNHSVDDRYIIQKKNGKIILAYKAFYDFLNSDKSWQAYQSMVLMPYPSLQKVHKRQIEWGSVDTVRFPKEVTGYKKEEFEKYLTQYDLKAINNLYDDVIEKSNQILSPIGKKPVDLCFFLPYGGGCFVIPEDTINTIYISMYIAPREAEKIMAHEYAHILHIDRRPEEPLTLKREVVSEGMAVYLTTRILKDIKLSNAVPFMPESSFEWCMQHEQMIKDSICLELNDTTERLFKRYISDGSWAQPPKGFVEKTAYFAGYRIIEKCIARGMTLEEICALSSDKVIKRSGYFD
jgi:hypothetical protein